MLEHFWHWLACVGGNKGHIAFGEARRLYTFYVDGLKKPFDQLDDNDFAAARHCADLIRTEQLYKKARKHIAQEGRSDNVTTADYQLGLLFHLQGRLSEARQHLQLAADALQSSVAAGLSQRSMLSGCYYHLGIIAMRVGNRAEAERLLHKSLEIDDTDMDHGGMAMNMAALETFKSWPFDAVLSAGTGISDDRLPQVLTADESSLPTIADGLARHDSAAVFTGEWSVLLRMVVSPAVVLGPLSGLLGWFAVAVFFLEYGNKTSVDALFADWGFLGVACMMGAYLSGFAARLLASTLFEIRRRRRQGLVTVHVISCAGLTALTVLWVMQVSALAMGWSIVLGCVGWYLAELFLQTVKPYTSELS